MFLLSVVAGLLAGFAAGMLGVSPGGVLIPLSVMILGLEQHTAQALSLVAQVFPTSLLGLRQYRLRQKAIAPRLLLWIAVGFLVGTFPGAMAAIHTSGVALRWTYVGYLLTLLAIIVFNRGARAGTAGTVPPTQEPPPKSAYQWGVVGIAAGLSSGYLGIGGGLAITVGLSAFLGLSQLRAQSASLAVALLPLTLPAVITYLKTPWFPSWISIGGIVVGLLGGTDLGARVASIIPERALKSALAALLLIFAAFMSYANLPQHAPASTILP